MISLPLQVKSVEKIYSINGAKKICYLFLSKVPSYYICRRNGRWNDKFDVSKNFKGNH